jgi:hypothetical protein
MFKTLPPQSLKHLASSIRNGEYSLLLGAGANVDATDSRGNKLPTSDAFRLELCDLTGADPKSPLQRIVSILTADQIGTHISERFRGCKPGPSARLVVRFLWHRIFTLNVDDALITAYRSPTVMQRGVALNYSDIYKEFRDRTEVPLVHLHGTVTRQQDGYVFSRDEYVRNMKTLNPWMANLAQFLSSEPFVIAGTSLDEVDLDYFMTYRNESSQRSDRGPSIYVEPFPDPLTVAECKRRGLELYKGTFEEFLEDLDQAVPDRPAPINLVPTPIRDLLPKNTPVRDVLSFSADFELAPAHAAPVREASRFLLGHPPSWADLAANNDVGRTLTVALSDKVRTRLTATSDGPRIFVLADDTGSGKSTILRRIAFDFARQGVRVLLTSTLSRLAPDVISRCLDQIEGPVLVIVDDCADHVSPILEISTQLRKPDVVFLAAERGYRKRHVSQVLSNTDAEFISGLILNEIETTQLIELFTGYGLNSAPADRSQKTTLISEPIAVACCRIMNNYDPLDRIVRTLLDKSVHVDRIRYYSAAISQYCFNGGIRYDILFAATSSESWDDQLNGHSPLPLAFADDSRRDFIIPLNSSIASRVLEQLPKNERLKAFLLVANGIASRVNRETIKRRTPEAKLAARLFDYDHAVERFLGDEAFEFYEQTRDLWRWSSRYWEQLALYYLSQFRREGSKKGSDLLQRACAHAQFAVSLERHPLTLTTLGKVLLTRVNSEGAGASDLFNEAFNLLTEATEMERNKWSRISIHSFVLLFRGTAKFVVLGGRLSRPQLEKLRTAAGEATLRFSSDVDIRRGLADINVLL